MDYLDEEWRAIAEFPGYFISDHGRVWSERTNTILSPSDNGKGYLTLRFRVNGSVYGRSIHRLVAEAFIPPYHGVEVNHIDGDKTYCHVSNLEWSTRRHNLQHARDLGLMKPYQRAVRIIETGEVFASIVACAEYIGGNPASVGGCARGNLKSHRGYHFEYVED